MTEADIKEKSVLIRINKRFQPGMTPEALYEAVRGIWVIGPKREKVDYAFAVYRGEIQEVYAIHQWLPAGTLDYATRTVKANPRRWEFEGKVAEDIRDKYVGLSVKHYFPRHAVNPITYAGNY